MYQLIRQAASIVDRRLEIEFRSPCGNFFVHLRLKNRRMP
jgi:hypothetical protein